MDHSLLLSAKEFIMAVVALQLGVPFMKWAATKLFSRLEKDGESQAHAVKALRGEIAELAKEVRSGVEVLKDRMSEFSAHVRVQDERIEHLSQRMERLEQRFKE
jgi:hypothetical protein